MPALIQKFLSAVSRLVSASGLAFPNKDPNTCKNFKTAAKLCNVGKKLRLGRGRRSFYEYNIATAESDKSGGAAFFLSEAESQLTVRDSALMRLICRS